MSQLFTRLFGSRSNRRQLSRVSFNESLEPRVLLTTGVVPDRLLQLGDYDGDRDLGSGDIDLLSHEVRTLSDDLSFDANQDGEINEGDRSFWVHTLHRTFFGDADLSGDFGTGDLITVFQAGKYEDGIPKNTTWSEGDFNGDAEFGTGDLILAFQDGGFGIGKQPLSTPTIDLAPQSDSLPIGDQTTIDRFVTLEGEADPFVRVELADAVISTVSDVDGRFSLTGVPLQLGQNQLSINLFDVNGTAAAAAGQFTRSVTPGFTLLDEGSQFVVEQSLSIDLGQAIGKRELRFRVDTGFDKSDQNSTLEDTFSVYLVDSADRSRTLLDRGENGTSLFSLSGKSAEMAKGLVRFDGEFVEIDLTGIPEANQGTLIFQLLNLDSDESTQIAVGDFTNSVDALGTPMPAVNMPTPVVEPGNVVDFSSWSRASDVGIDVKNIRFDSNTGTQIAELMVTNNGADKGRQIAVTFPGLPVDVTLENRSGIDNGRPYVNLSPAIYSGGLGNRTSTVPLRLEFKNPNQVRFSFTPQVFAGPPNRAPSISPIAPISVMPGDRVEIPLVATDADGDTLTFSIRSEEPLPSGRISADSHLIFTPTSDDMGSYNFEVLASDGAAMSSTNVTLRIVADPISTTRITGTVQNTDLEPLSGVPVAVGDTVAVTDANGSFVLDFGNDDLTTDTIHIRANELGGNTTYPFLAEKLSEVFHREVLRGVNNVISRPIYLPAIDMANAVTVNPAQDMVITTTEIPGASLFVKAGTARNPDGTPFTDEISITRVPVERAPLALPESLGAGLLITVQPAGLTFTEPAPITLPNTGGWAPGTQLDFFQVSPVSGVFEDFGDMVVNEDGTLVETISGGVSFSSWGTDTPPPPPPEESDDNPDCEDCEESGQSGSTVSFASGAVSETHELVSYQSMGQTHGLVLTYDSLRADPRPIFHVGYDDVDPEAISVIPEGLQVVARVGVFVNNVEVVSNGFDQPGEFGLLGGENFFSIPTGSGPLDVAVQIDLSDHPTGVYPYRFSSGIRNLVDTPWGTFLAGGQTITSNELIHINSIDSPFGSGWGISGLQEIVEGPEGSVAIIDGDGSELRWQPGTRQVRDLLIQDSDNHAVLRYDGISGGLVEEFVSSGSGGLNGPHNPTFGPDGNLYVLSGNTQQVLRYDGESGDFIDVFVDQNEGGFTGAAELAFDTDGNLYAATVASQGVLRFDPQGEFIGAIAGSADGVSQACGVEIGADGNLYVLDTSGSERILRFDPVTGNLIDVFVQPGNIPNSCDFDFGPEGDIFVTSLDRADVRRFSGVDGSFLGVFARTGGLPSGITFGPDENFYVNVTGTTQRYDGETGEHLDTFVPNRGGFPNFFPPVEGESDREFINPVGDFSLLERIPGGFRRTLTDQTVFIFNDQNKLASKTDRNGNVTNYSYDADGNITKIIDPVGQETIFAYSNGRVTSITDPANRVTSFAYDERGNLIRITDPDQTTRSFEYDSKHHMISETDKRGNQEFDFYDPFGRLTRAVLADGAEINVAPRQVIGLYSPERTSNPFERPNAIRTQDGNSTYVDKNGNVTMIQLDEAGQEITSLDAIGGTPIIQRDPDTNLVKQLVDARGNRTEFEHDLLGNLVAIENVSDGGKNRSFTFDPVFNQRTSSTDELGRTTLFEIDSTNGNIIAETKVIGDEGGGDDIRRTFTFESRGLPETVTDSLGRVTKMDYDNLGRVVTQTFALGTDDERTQHFEYDIAGNRTKSIDAFGNATSYEYDTMNRVTRMVHPDPDGDGPLGAPFVTYRYDAAGNLVETTDAKGVTFQYEYDTVGRQIRSVDSLGNDTTLVYDNGGNLVTVIDAEGKPTRHVYDARNRLIEIIDPAGGRSRFAYDRDDNRTSVIDSAGNETRFEFNSQGHVVREIGPLGAEIQYDYDGANNVTRQTDSDGREIQREFDEFNRLIRETWVNAGNEIRYTYDDAGNLTSAIDNFSSIVMTYNQQDQVVRVDTSGTPNMPSVVLNFSYDADGRLTAIADTIDGVSKGIQAYEYDALDRVRQVQQSGADVSPKSVEFAYNAVGQATVINRYADLNNQQFVARSTFTYDALHRVKIVRHDNATTQISSFNYQYDSLGRTTSASSNDGTAGYTYDDLGRLLTANYDNANRTDESFAYDANGNRTSTNLGNYSVQGNNQIESDGQYDYRYDGQGNLIERIDLSNSHRREFRWDFRNRLVAIIDRNDAGNITQQFEYTYDALNRRVGSRNVIQNEITTYVYAGDNVLLEFVEEGGAEAKLLQRNLFAPAVDLILAQESEGSVTWHLTDRQGSVTELIDSNGDVVNNIVYDAYGKPIVQSEAAPPSRYLFSGREYDEETELYYNRRRFYDPSLGRFISPDPIGFSGGTRNLYEYVGNTPVGRRDPDGLEGDLQQRSSNRQHTSDLIWGVGQIIQGITTFDPGRIGSAVNAGLGGIRDTATQFGRLFGGSNGQSNAFQHAMWQALLAYKYGKERAKEIGDKHESQMQKSCGGQRRDTEADLRNNEKGREIGDEVRKRHPNQPEITPEILQEIANGIFDAARAGQLDFGGGGSAPGAGPNGGAPGGGLYNRGGSGFIDGTPINSRPNVR